MVLRYTAPGSAEFNDMQRVVLSHVDVAGVGGEQAVATVGPRSRSGYPSRSNGRAPAAACSSSAPIPASSR